MEGERARNEREDSDVFICLRSGLMRTEVKKKQEHRGYIYMNGV